MRREIFFVILVFCGFAAARNETIVCVFALDDDHYTCRLPALILEENQMFEIDASGHLEGFDDVDVTKVEQFGGNVSFVITELFTTFTNLRRLQLSFTGLTRIQSNAFANADNLESFLSYGNPLRVLEENAFSGIQSLTSIDLAFNQVEIIHELAFEGLSNLEFLGLGNNNIGQLHPSLFQALSNLTNLQLASNRLETLDGRIFDNNQRLATIGFYGNQINAMGRGILDRLDALYILDMRQNRCDSTYWFVYDDVTVDTIREGLRICFENHVEVDDVKKFVLELHGTLILRDEQGNVVLRL